MGRVANRVLPLLLCLFFQGCCDESEYYEFHNAGEASAGRESYVFEVPFNDPQGEYDLFFSFRMREKVLCDTLKVEVGLVSPGGRYAGEIVTLHRSGSVGRDNEYPYRRRVAAGCDTGLWQVSVNPLKENGLKIDGAGLRYRKIGDEL